MTGDPAAQPWLALQQWLKDQSDDQRLCLEAWLQTQPAALQHEPSCEVLLQVWITAQGDALQTPLRHLDHAADLDDGLALGDQLRGSFELADDLLRCVPGAFHGRVPGPVWPAEDPHSPWIDCQGPRQN
jgi:hypothetical protein